MVYSWNVCVNVPVPELHTCEHCNVDLHVPCCSRQSPHCPNPLPPVWCSIARDCRRLVETEKRQTYMSFLYCSSRNQTHFQFLCACQWDQIHIRAHSFLLMPNTLWTSLPLISHTYIHILTLSTWFLMQTNVDISRAALPPTGQIGKVFKAGFITVTLH